MDPDHKIVFLVDTSPTKGGMTITNDAENVLRFIKVNRDIDWRVVYEDTEGEMWEIVPLTNAFNDVRFERWDGLMWDILKRK
jgi:hypothetical protein